MVDSLDAKLSGDGAGGNGTVKSDVVAAVVTAYYPKLVNSADSARSRAQAAYAVSNALAGGLVGASLLTVFSNAPTGTKIVGFAAVVFWITASLLYVRAVSSPLPPEVPGDKKDGTSFVEYVLSTSREDRKTIDRRQRWANSIAAFALAVTAVSFALLLFGPVPSTRASVILTNSGVKQISSTCGHPVTRLNGSVTDTSLSASFLVVELRPGECGSSTVIRIPASYVGSIRSG